MSEIWFDDDWDVAELAWLNELAEETISILGECEPEEPAIEEGDIITISGFDDEPSSARVSKVTPTGRGEYSIELTKVPEESCLNDEPDS